MFMSGVLCLSIICRTSGKYLHTVLMCTDLLFTLLHCGFAGESGCHEGRDVQCFGNREFFTCVYSEDRRVCVVNHMAQGPVCTLVSALGELVAAARRNPKEILKRVDIPIQETSTPTTMSCRHIIKETVLGLLCTYPVTNTTLPLMWV